MIYTLSSAFSISPLRALQILALCCLTGCCCLSFDSSDDQSQGCNSDLIGDPAPFDCRTETIGCGFGLQCDQYTGQCEPDRTQQPPNPPRPGEYVCPVASCLEFTEPHTFTLYGSSPPSGVDSLDTLPSRHNTGTQTRYVYCNDAEEECIEYTTDSTLEPYDTICTCRESQSAACFTDNGCNAGNLCVRGVCRSPITSQYCKEDTDCLSGSLCDLNTRTCLPVQCTQSSACGGQKTCQAGRCVTCSDEEPCSFGSTCEDGRCVEDLESLQCDEATPCPDGFACESSPPDETVGRCSPLPELCSGGIGDNSTLETATRLFDDTLYRDALCTGEEDYFNFELQAEQGAIVRLRYQPFRTPNTFAVTLVDRDGSILPLTIQETDQTGTLFFSIPQASEAGIYAVRVHLATGLASDYQISIQRTEPGFCINDRFEDNNSPQRSTPLLLNTPTRGSVCPGDTDIFSITGVSQPFDIRLNLYPTHPADTQFATLFEYLAEVETTQGEEEHHTAPELFVPDEPTPFDPVTLTFRSNPDAPFDPANTFLIRLSHLLAFDYHYTIEATPSSSTP